MITQGAEGAGLGEKEQATQAEMPPTDPGLAPEPCPGAGTGLLRFTLPLCPEAQADLGSGHFASVCRGPGAVRREEQGWVRDLRGTQVPPLPSPRPYLFSGLGGQSSLLPTFSLPAACLLSATL